VKIKRKTKAAETLPPFPNEFWEKILVLRRDEPKRFNLFSPGFKRSAEVYEEERDRALTAQRRAA
jgi:hypothetical protein